MDRLSARLRTLAAADAASSDPSDAAVDRGWQRLSAVLATPVATATIGSTAAAAAATKKSLGVLAIVLLGLGGAAALPRTEIVAVPSLLVDHDATARPAVPMAQPVAKPPAPVIEITAPPVVAPPVASPVTKAQRDTRSGDPLAADVRALGRARADLDAGRTRRALKAARAILRRPDGPVAPEARAIEAIAACELGLPAGPSLASAFAARHPSSPLRGRVARACAGTPTP